MIYEDFRKEFPDFSVGKLNEEELKSPAAKEVSHGIVVLFQRNYILNSIL